MHQQQTAFENIMGKEEIARNEQFLLFPQCFLVNQIIVSPLVHIFDRISLFAAEFKEPEIGVSRVNPFPNKALLLHVCSTSLLKTLWEKEKLPITSIFFLFPFGEHSAIFIKFRLID